MSNFERVIGSFRSAGVTDEELAPLLKKLEGDSLTKAEGALAEMVAGDRAAFESELARREGAIVEKATALRRFESDWGQVLKEREDQISRLSSDLDAARKSLSDYGLDEHPRGTVRASTPVQPPNTSAAELRDVAAAFPLVPARMLKIMAEHSQLFGNGEAPDFENLIRINSKEGLSLDDAWKREYKVDERRKKLGEEKVQRRVDDAVKAALEKQRSELLQSEEPVRFREIPREGSVALSAGNGVPVSESRPGAPSLAMRGEAQRRAAIVDQAVQQYRQGRVEAASAA